MPLVYHFHIEACWTSSRERKAQLSEWAFKNVIKINPNLVKLTASPTSLYGGPNYPVFVGRKVTTVLHVLLFVVFTARVQNVNVIDGLVSIDSHLFLHRILAYD